MSQHEANWDLDSDEIASVASEDLYESRPNRWKGAKSTWRHLTEEERLLWRSMKQLQDEDLGLHLYNVFVLKKRATNPETAQDQIVQTDDGQEAVWAPPKSWTAWPMRQKHIPKAGLFQEEGDEDDAFTFRRKEKTIPGSELRAEITATVLRIAKERFSRRKPPQTLRPSIESPDPGDESKGLSSDASETGLSSQPDGSQATDASEADDVQASRTRKKAGRTFDAVVSANDDLSGSLLKPSVQHLLSQVDKTLTILHNARVAGLEYASDSSETETERESDTSQTPKGKRRSRGRPRLPPQSASAALTSCSMSRRGRPKTVHVPEPGETPEQMALRIARRGHRRLPTTEADRAAAFEEWMRRGDEREAREQRGLSSRLVPKGPESQDDDDAATSVNLEAKIRRWGLRDWSDVVGAAALAGFAPGVIERTAQRCANLFGQGMELTRLDEVPAARATATRAGIRATTYKPERIRLSATPSDSDDDDDDDGEDYWKSEAGLKQRRIASRQASLARSSREASVAATSPRSSHSPSQPMSRSSSTGGFCCPVPSCDRAAVGFSRRANLDRHILAVHPDDDDDDPRALPAASSNPSPRSRSRSRSRSVSHSSAGLLFCPLAFCERAASGFTRRANLQRHMQLVHPGHDPGSTALVAAAAAAVIAAASAPEDSDDETVGAVHVDGFLRTINPGQGWRGKDAAPRQSRKRSAREPTPAPAGRPAKKLNLASSEDSE